MQRRLPAFLSLRTHLHVQKYHPGTFRFFQRPPDHLFFKWRGSIARISPSRYTGTPVHTAILCEQPLPIYLKIFRKNAHRMKLLRRYRIRRCRNQLYIAELSEISLLKNQVPYTFLTENCSSLFLPSSSNIPGIRPFFSIVIRL